MIPSPFFRAHISKIGLLAKGSAALALGLATFLGSVQTIDQSAGLAPVTGPHQAQASASSLRVTYAARLAGIRIGTGVLSVNMDGNRYTANISARTSAVGRLVSQGQGEAIARGVLGSSNAIPVSYDLTASEEDLTNIVRMRLSRGDITELSAEPPLSEHPNRVTVRAQHRRDVVDPVSALLMPVPNSESATGPAACNRTIPMFDGRQRYDIAFSFVRMEQVQFGNGQAVVCRVRYRPIAGHRDNRRTNLELAQNTNMYVWLTQVADGALVAPVRLEIGLDFGTLSVQALDFAAQ
ncbi:MAG: DUF3108 domain-containing protein [Devosiaceae bacterium]